MVYFGVVRSMDTLVNMATDKVRVVGYVQPHIKKKLETLAELRIRSLSNLMESVLTDLVIEAERSGELPKE